MGQQVASEDASPTAAETRKPGSNQSIVLHRGKLFKNVSSWIEKWGNIKRFILEYKNTELVT